MDTEEQLWRQFAKDEELNDEQVLMFRRYYALLLEWNTMHNITRITSLEEVINYHFKDSLRLSLACDLTSFASIADVGSGGGFPGIPLAIKYPHVSVLLIEVIQKKVAFLKAAIKELDLQNVHVSDFDWRTFIRKTDYSIDYFVARASLRPQELLRALSPTTTYADTIIVYWASHGWEPADEKERESLVHKYSYVVGSKQRELVVFKRQR